ncbi:MAG TPA: serine/threonine protein kinase, partial [Planctomycetaceae bacterium]|nr:serine/threonine protein kinase [Planctomycetaceae bacterium]
TAQLWNLATQKSDVTLEGHTKGIRSTTFGPNGKVMATSSGDATIRIWKIITQESNE